MGGGSTSKKELLMQRNKPQAVEAQIANLVIVAKNDPNADIRQMAIDGLWTICGGQIVGVMLKNSYRIDSDHAYHGMSYEERRDDVTSTSYIVFREWLDTFDPSMGVPFLAYTSQKSCWMMQDEKRRNSKRTRWVKISNPDGSSYGDDDDDPHRPLKKRGLDKESADNCDENPFTGEVNAFEVDLEWKDMVRQIRNSCKKNPKMLRFFDTMVLLNKEGHNCTDAKVAEKLGCTRANTGVQHKKFLKFMKDKGLDQEFRLLLAA